ncbi:MAG: hypothetical protein ACO3NZ_10790, partial [Pirellulales bacterium]
MPRTTGGFLPDEARRGETPLVGKHRSADQPRDGQLAWFGNPDPVDMKVNCPCGEETFDDEETTEEAQAGGDHREAA